MLSEYVKLITKFKRKQSNQPNGLHVISPTYVQAMTLKEINQWWRAKERKRVK